jgi:hypothetical protein
MAMGDATLVGLEMAEIATSSDPLPRRGEQVLGLYVPPPGQGAPP